MTQESHNTSHHLVSATNLCLLVVKGLKLV